MATGIGSYFRQLRALWRLPHRVDTAASTVPDALMNRLAPLQEQVRAAIQQVQATIDRTITERDASLRHDQIQRFQDLVTRLDALMDRLEFTDTAALGMHRARLRDRHGALDIETDHPVAWTSPDHLTPWGTARDNSRSSAFNARLLSLIPGDRLSLLDLGCSGGGAVRSMIEQGFLAAGIEGSDFSSRRLRAEWATIPDHLFTADLTRPFRIVSGAAPDGVRFGVITLWEVIEHIAEADLPALFDNMDRHLAPGGLVILSVSPNSDIIDGRELHQTIQERPWWTDKVTALGWRDHPRIVAWFGDDLVRWEANAPNSFHFALSRRHEAPALTRRAQRLLAG